MNVMIRFKQLITIFFLLILSGCALVPEEDTTTGQYLAPKDANDLLKQKGKNILFVDVRTQDELSSFGMPTFIDANVPYLFKKWNEEKKKVDKILNNDFVPAIEKKLKEKHLDKQSPIFLICQNGKRSSKSAEVLAKAGYQNVYSIIEGTQGWQKNDLPWSDDDFGEIDFDKL